MSYRNGLIFGLLTLVVLTGFGCARTPRDTTGFAQENTITVKAPFEEAWQTVKGVLREQELELYTRDKRGAFVAYTPMRRRFLQPTRVKYTIELGRVSAEETRIYIETIKQVYGVTLLTYPDWHDRKTKDNAGATAILDAIQAKMGGEAQPAAAAPVNTAEAK